MTSIAKKTEKYISQNPHIMKCLILDTINYSKLARAVCSECDISNVDAVIVACRRAASKLRKEKLPLKFRDILRNSRKSINVKKGLAEIKMSFKIREKYLSEAIDMLS